MLTHFLLPLVSLSIALSINPLVSAADSVILKNGNSLSGKLIDSDTSGILTLNHPDTKQPIKIRETSVERIVFDTVDRKNSILTESIKLLNGDHFPCTITELNNKTISFQSESLGNHTIARDKVSQIQFNTKANKTLYAGPGDDLRQWTTSTEDWKLKGGKLRVFKSSDAAKMISNLTENYILEFKTSWEQTAPHLRVCFSSDTEPVDRKSDYYYIDLNSHGISVYRSRKGKYVTLTQILRSNEIYGQSTLHVAIHVDRKNQKMALYLNGKLAKTISDPKTAPTGNYLVIKNLQRTGLLTEVSDIKISSWAGKVTEDIKSKAKALDTHDLITDLSGGIMTGQIIGISRTADKTSLNFKAPFAKKNSTIPSTAIDLLEFKTTEGSPNLGAPNYQLNLVSGGLVSFSSSQMEDGKLTVNHPILGKISLPTTRLSSVVVIPKPTEEDKNR
ncbi:MAG: hypothetical protein ACI9SQ_000397 [Rubritalea sp.]|jgi:hypothetical protein